MVLDLAFTLVCQPANYWQDYNLHNEANPIGRALLSINPACFVAAFILYTFLVLFLAAKAWRLISIPLVTLVFVFHAKASASWLPNIYRNVFFAEANEQWLYVGYSLAIAVISLFYFHAVKPFASTA